MKHYSYEISSQGWRSLMLVGEPHLEPNLDIAGLCTIKTDTGAVFHGYFRDGDFFRHFRGIGPQVHVSNIVSVEAFEIKMP